MTVKSEQAGRELLTELHHALQSQAQEASQSRGTLREAVCAYVEVELARGFALALIIKTVTGILRKAEDDASAGRDPTPKRDSALAKQLVAWCVEFHRQHRAGIA